MWNPEKKSITSYVKEAKEKEEEESDNDEAYFRDKARKFLALTS